MKEPQTGRQVGDDRGCFQFGGRERGGGAGLVMVLHEARELVLEVETGLKMAPHRPGVTLAEPIVEPLVVGVVEPLLQHGPFEVPIDLGHEAEARNPLAHAPGRVRPEEWRTAAPRSFKDVRQDQHRHVATHPVALTRDPEKLANHGLLRGGIAVIELHRIGPAGEVRVASECQHPLTRASLTRV